MTQEKLSRRQFLKIAGVTGAAASLTVCGVTATRPDLPSVELASYHYGDIHMNKRVLVTYASYAGATLEVAAKIGETLSEQGFAADVLPVEENPSVEDYQAILIGSAVHYGEWLPEAISFVENNQQTLSTLPVGVFCVHIRNTGDDETSLRERLAYLNSVRALINPAAEGFFPGRFDRRGAKLLMPDLLANFVPKIDMLDLETSSAWAIGVSPLLQSA